MKDATYRQQYSVGRSDTIVLLAVRTQRELGGKLPIYELVLVITGIVNTAPGWAAPIFWSTRNGSPFNEFSCYHVLVCFCVSSPPMRRRPR